MIERKERKPYWRHTKWQMIASLNHNKFLGFPLGYLLAAQGLFLIALITIGGFVNRQDAIDHWHGAHEDN